MGLTRATEPPRQPAYDWEAVAEEVRKHPGEWRSMGQVPYGHYVAIKGQRIAALKPGLGFEVATRNNIRSTPRTCELLLRYNPDLSDPIAEVAARRRAVTRRNRKERK